MPNETAAPSAWLVRRIVPHDGGLRARPGEITTGARGDSSAGTAGSEQLNELVVVDFFLIEQSLREGVQAGRDFH